MDIEKCLKELNIEEKIGLLEGADKGFTNAIKRLDIPRVLLADGPHGVRVVKGTDPDGNQPYIFTMAAEMEATTAFPCEAATASTWNTELARRIGKTMGEECQALGVGVLLGPGVNGKRSPLGGRNFEYFSEDPYLSGKMAAAIVNGIQKEGVGTCLKHYVLNDQESRRMSVDVHADERTLWEIYLKPFLIAIQESDPWSIMAAYNKVDGESMTHNRKLLLEILREKIGYKGMVLSDWGAVQDKVYSVKNGLDLQMPGPGSESQKIREALENGILTEQELDERVRHVLELVQKVSGGRKQVVPNWKIHHETAVQAAEEGIVLLKNEEGILPLKKKCKVAVVGELAEKPYYTGGSSSSLTPRYLDEPLKHLEEQAEVAYAVGYHGSRTSEELLKEARETARQAEVVLFFGGASTTEGADREDIDLPQVQKQVLKEVAAVNANVVLIMQCGSVIAYREIETFVKGIFHAWIPGEGFGKALVDLLFGQASPSGKLTETFPVYLENTPAYQDFPGIKDNVYYHEGLLTGYRYYDTKKIQPLYPFGFGLSYTSFAYSNLKLSTNRLLNGEKLKVSIDVKNTGDYRGKEVVQVYVQDEVSDLFRPEKELAAFAKVELEPEEMKTITMELTEDAFAYYVPHLEKFAVESGRFYILIGASSQDIRAKGTVEFLSADEVRLPLGINDAFKDFLADDRYSPYARKLLEILHVDETHVFYDMLYGASLTQAADLFNLMGLSQEQEEKVLEDLVERKEITI